MTALNQVIDYLRKKVSKVNLNNQKANRGGILVKTHKEWEQKLEKIVMLSFQTMQSQFSKHDNAGEIIGECKLTMVSMSVGKTLAGIIQKEPLKSKRDQLALGDLVIEGFVYHGFVELERPARRDESYILKVTPKWAELADMPAEAYRYAVRHSHQEIIEAPKDSIHKSHSHLFNSEAPYVKALHNLQQVRWQINSPVLEVVLANKNKFLPPQHEMDTPEKLQWWSSKRVEWEFVTNKAICINEWDGYYQSMDLDYRGRMYNEESFLNYQGADLAKGLKLFYTPQLINESGQFWLAVHTAASYNQSYQKDAIPEWCEQDYKAYLESEGLDDISVDKMTLNDRATWTTNNWEKILACELDMKAEKPVTFLACCYEWLQIRDTGYTSIPVAIDGSNNGWQHLGAISKDTQTGKLVGLVPTVIQSDFYVQTAKRLISLTTDEHVSNVLKKMPMKHIRKGISKRGSMTRAYSAGAGKIADNMYFDCRQADYDKKYGVTKKVCNKVAKTLVNAIEEVCPGPLKTMEYLQKLAEFMLGKYEVVGPGDIADYKELKKRRFELICEKELTAEQLEELDATSKELQLYSHELAYGEGHNFLEWVTPSGFVARYEKFTTESVKERVTLNGKQIKHVLQSPTDRPDIRGFMCGISPNYIHSLDASHMALVIQDWTKDFGAVHDSFSTNANDVEELLQATKDVFIGMYDHPNYFDVIRENLTNNIDNVDQPELGDLDIGGINGSEYFFA